MAFRKRKKAHVASPVLEKRQQVLEAPSGAYQAGWFKDLRPAECPPAASSWLFFGQPETSSVCWQLGSIKNWSAGEKTLLEGQKHWCWAFTKRILGPPDEGPTCCRQWRFDSLVNSSPFSQDNTVCIHIVLFSSAPYHYWNILLRKLSNFLPHKPYFKFIIIIIFFLL